MLKIKQGFKMVKRGRPKRVRYVQKMPKITQFSPRGKPGRPDEVYLTIDQFEAIKLVDGQGFNQEQGAVAMGISRPTFGRILRAGRKVLANALINGKIIKIGMGDAQVGVRQLDLGVGTSKIGRSRHGLAQILSQALDT